MHYLGEEKDFSTKILAFKGLPVVQCSVLYKLTEML